MGSDATSELEVELALDRVLGQLAQELPVHMRAFAAAYAAAGALPAAPDLAGRASTVAIGRRALVHPALAAHGLALLRLAAPLVIERDAAVVAARAQVPRWEALATLTAARDAAARARFGRGAREVLHALHGAVEPAGAAIVPPASAAWNEEDLVLDARAIEGAWRELARRHGVAGRVTIVQADARPRAFVVEAAAGGEVIVVVPARVATPAARFALLHELGHALANLASPAGLPRVLDEAVASYAARLLEVAEMPWFSPLARAARARRSLLAHALDAIERGQGAPNIAERPPWALWHDPCVQAMYVTAESVADRLWAALGPSPAPGALATAIASERARIDHGLVI